jgi:hypothetical protein
MAIHTPAAFANGSDDTTYHHGSSSRVPDGAAPVGAGDPSSRSRMVSSRLIGALFLAGFLSYGVGFALVTSVVGKPDFLATVPAHRTTLALGAFLMLMNSVVDVGKGVLFFPILESHGKRTALAYLAAMIFEVVLLAVGVLSLLMIIPVAQAGVDAGPASAGPASAGWATALGSLAVASNTMAYQIGEMSLGLGCIFLCALLFRARLIPRPLAGWGVIGYVILMSGTIAEVFGVHIGLMLSLPGAVFELAVGLWLLIKGFQPAAYARVGEARGNGRGNALGDLAASAPAIA